MTDTLDEVAAAWNEAGREFGFRVVAPYSFSFAGEPHRCAAYLADFGSALGMIVALYAPTDAETVSPAVEFAKAGGLYCSLIQGESYRRFDRKLFIDTLKDWGYFGAPEHKPNWSHR